MIKVLWRGLSSMRTFVAESFLSYSTAKKVLKSTAMSLWYVDTTVSSLCNWPPVKFFWRCLQIGTENFRFVRVSTDARFRVKLAHAGQKNFILRNMGL